MRRPVPATENTSMTVQSDVSVVLTTHLAPERDAPAPTPAIPRQRHVETAPETGHVPQHVLDELQHISECYLAARAKANVLRTLPVGNEDDEDRTRRNELARALQRLNTLRERRSALLDAYELPSSTGRAPEPSAA